MPLLPFAILLSFMWGLSAVLHKIMVTNIPIEAVLVFSTLIYATLTLGYYLYHRKKINASIPNLTPKLVLILLFTVIACSFGPYIIYLTLVRKNDSYLVTALTNTSPIFAMLLAYFILKERVTAWACAGIFMVFIGIILLAVHSRKIQAMPVEPFEGGRNL